jgi:hypothetical protein
LAFLQIIFKIRQVLYAFLHSAYDAIRPAGKSPGHSSPGTLRPRIDILINHSPDYLFHGQGTFPRSPENCNNIVTNLFPLFNIFPHFFPQDFEEFYGDSAASQSSSRRSGWNKFKFRNSSGHAPDEFLLSACKRATNGSALPQAENQFEEVRQH